MILQKNTNYNTKNTLFADIKIIGINYEPKLNISEELLTCRTLAVISETELSAAAEEMVQKMFNGCKLLQNDYYVYHLQHSWRSFRQLTNLKEVVLFGVSEQDFGINIELPLNKPISFDGKTWIKTTAIPEMLNNQDLKNALWQQALKPHFLQ